MPNAEDITGKIHQIRPRPSKNKAPLAKNKRRKSSRFRSNLQERRLATDYFFYGVIGAVILMLLGQFALAAL